VAALLGLMVGMAALCVSSGSFYGLSQQQEGATSLVSAADAEMLAGKDEAAYKFAYGRAKQDAATAEQDQRLAAKDARIRRSILRAAAVQRRNYLSQAETMHSLEEREGAVRQAMQDLEGGMSQAKQDERRSAWLMHQHLLATNRVLGEVRSLTAEKVREGKQALGVERLIQSTDGELGEALSRLKKGEAVLAAGRRAETKISDKAQQADIEGRYEASVDAVLASRGEALQRTAVLLQQRGGKTATKDIQQLAAREMGLERQAGETALAVAKLRSKAEEAQSYVGVLQRDMGAAKKRVGQEAMRVRDLYQRARRDRMAVLAAAQRERVLGSDAERGVQAVVANEEAFRRNQARLENDERAVSEAQPRLQQTGETLRAMARRVRADISRGEKDGVAFVKDVREAGLLQDSERLHQEAAQVLGSASSLDGEGAGGLLDEGKHYLELSKLDVQDAGDSKKIADLEQRREP